MSSPPSPAYEPILLARKPLAGTLAASVERYGTGAINIDRCRVGMMRPEEVARSGRSTSGMFAKGGVDWRSDGRKPQGRWPANVLHDGSDEVVAAFEAFGEKTTKPGIYRNDSGARSMFGPARPSGHIVSTGDSGSASRFFYCAKASRSEREAGLDAFEEMRRTDGRAKDIENPRLRTSAPASSTARMEGWPLVALLTAGGFFLQSTLPVNVTFAHQIAPVSAATVSSLMMGFAWGTRGLTAPLVGSMADHAGIEATLTFTACLPLLAALCAVRLPGGAPDETARRHEGGVEPSAGI